MAPNSKCIGSESSLPLQLTNKWRSVSPSQKNVLGSFKFSIDLRYYRGESPTTNWGVYAYPTLSQQIQLVHLIPYNDLIYLNDIPVKIKNTTSSANVWTRLNHYMPCIFIKTEFYTFVRNSKYWNPVSQPLISAKLVNGPIVLNFKTLTAKVTSGM